VCSSDLEEAIAHLESALAVQPRYAEAHNSLGKALFQKGKPEEALVHFRTALEIRPNFATAHINLGRMLLSQGQLKDAIEHFQAAVQIQPFNAEFLGMLAAACAQAGQLEEAVAMVRRGLEASVAQSNAAQTESLRAQLAAYQSDLHSRNTPQAPRD
jgi:Flp pilus assembly protein TadD